MVSAISILHPFPPTILFLGGMRSEWDFCFRKLRSDHDNECHFTYFPRVHTITPSFTHTCVSSHLPEGFLDLFCLLVHLLFRLCLFLSLTYKCWKLGHWPLHYPLTPPLSTDQSDPWIEARLQQLHTTLEETMTNLEEYQNMCYWKRLERVLQQLANRRHFLGASRLRGITLSSGLLIIHLTQDHIVWNMLCILRFWSKIYATSLHYNSYYILL